MLGLSNSLTNGSFTETFTPKDLGTSLKLWLQNTTTGGVIVSNSGTDGTSANRLSWKDASGSNNHAFQDTTADKPTVSEGGMDFELDEADHLDLTTSIDAGHPNPFTLSVVVKRESAATQTSILGGGSTEFVTFKNSDDKLGVRTAGTNATNSTITFSESDLWLVDTKFILTVTKDADGVLKFYKNGVAKAESSGGNSTNAGQTLDFNVVGTKVGSTGPFDGVIYELVYCNRVLDAADLEKLTGWLRQYI